MTPKLCLLLLLIFLGNGKSFAQEKTKKQEKEELKLAWQAYTEGLVNSGIFVFNAETAIPQGFRPVSLSSSNFYVSFSPDSIISSLPFYGKTYGNAGFGDDEGFKFIGKPEEYTCTKNKKYYLIKTLVRYNNNSYRLLLTVWFEGNASLAISSNNRSPVTFEGAISDQESNAIRNTF